MAGALNSNSCKFIQIYEKYWWTRSIYEKERSRWGVGEIKISPRREREREGSPRATWLLLGPFFSLHQRHFVMHAWSRRIRERDPSVALPVFTHLRSLLYLRLFPPPLLQPTLFFIWQGLWNEQKRKNARHESAFVNFKLTLRGTTIEKF